MIIMSNIIETLLLRNLQEVFGEGDPERRRSANVWSRIESKPVSAQIACSASGYDTAMAGAVDLDLRDWVAPGVALAPRLSIAARVNQSIG
jgi:hypothetical protein